MRAVPPPKMANASRQNTYPLKLRSASEGSLALPEHLDGDRADGRDERPTEQKDLGMAPIHAQQDQPERGGDAGSDPDRHQAGQFKPREPDDDHRGADRDAIQGDHATQLGHHVYSAAFTSAAARYPAVTTTTLIGSRSIAHHAWSASDQTPGSPTHCSSTHFGGLCHLRPCILGPGIPSCAPPKSSQFEPPVIVAKCLQDVPLWLVRGDRLGDAIARVRGQREPASVLGNPHRCVSRAL